MRAVIQRVSRARVVVDGRELSVMGRGLLVLLGAGKDDGMEEVQWMAEKITTLRVFPDQQGKMNLSLRDIKGEMIAVSQFTLYGDCRRGRRPSFSEALEPQAALELYRKFIQRVRELGITCGEGIFGADMQVELVNDGPVTFLLDSGISRRSGITGFAD
jgi:D-tyrosyl-tRNA(Tyr) deacylase